MVNLRFGVDIDAQLLQWWVDEYLPTFHALHGDDAKITVLVYSTSMPVVMYPYPDFPVQHRLTTSPDETDVAGLEENVHRKFRLVARSGENSGKVCNELDFLEEGDFPHPGAGFWLGYYGGASGLPDGDADFDVFKAVAEKLEELRTAPAIPAVAASHARVDGWKYLEGEGLPPAVHDDSTAADSTAG